MNQSPNQEELLNRPLPIWPQMLVWGNPVTEAQAKDIIFRTDVFLTRTAVYGGRNQQRNDWIRKQLGFDQIIQESKQLKGDFLYLFEVDHLLNKEMGVVETPYLCNDWASGDGLCGTMGWCHPNGVIWSAENVGKHPSVSVIYNTWTKLVIEFPYLNLTATLIDGEFGNEGIKMYPLVSMRVADGKVTLIEPVLPKPEVIVSDGQGLPDAWIIERGVQVKAMIENLRKNNQLDPIMAKLLNKEKEQNL